jgi:hypothetical protein
MIFQNVVEQAIFYESILWHLRESNIPSKLTELSLQIQSALTMDIDPAIIKLQAALPQFILPDTMMGWQKN